MGVFSGLEGSLEKYIEGFFKDKFKGRVQPAEIAKRLAREMRDCRRVSVNRIYVPNTFTVHLSAGDYDNIVTLEASLAKELQDYVRQKAKEKRYTLAGAPTVEFVCVDDEKTGYVHIVSDFSEDLPEQEQSAQEEIKLEQTQMFHLTKEMTAASPMPLPNVWLEVAAGPEKGRVINLPKASQVIGRHSGCDIILRDTSISRRQARLERRNNGFIIEDLGSTNGTWVNGGRIGTRALAPGDEIAFGTTVCIYKVDE